MRLVFSLLFLISTFAFAGKSADSLSFQQVVAGDLEKYYGRTVLNELDSAFLRLWENYTANTRQSFSELYDSLVQAETMPYPYFKELTLTSIIALDSVGLPAAELEHILNIGNKVLAHQGNGDFQDFHRYMRMFLYNNALYHSSSHQVKLDGTWELMYKKPEAAPVVQLPVLPDERQLEEEETVSTDTWGDDSWGDDDGWGTSSDDWSSDDGWSDDDDWGTSDGGWNTGDSWNSGDTWGNENETSAFGDENRWEGEPEAAAVINTDIFATEQVTVAGAYIDIKDVNLMLSTPYDTVNFKGITGQLIIDNYMLNAQKGFASWQEMGIDKDIQVDFNEFIWDVSGRRFTAEKVLLTNNEISEEPIEGHFAYYSKKRHSSEISDYPQFISYRSDNQINFNDPQLTVTGGYTIRGLKETTAARLNERNRITYKKDGAVIFDAVAEEPFIIEDSTLISPATHVRVFHKRDSIVNQQVKLSYHYPDQELVLERADKPFRRSLYISSYFNTEVEADALMWNLKADSLELTSLNARDKLAVIFRSNRFYDDKVIPGLSQYTTFNPFLVIISYAVSKGGITEFYLGDLADEKNIDERQLKNAITYLDEQEFLDFENGVIRLKEKMIHYYRSYRNLFDYDKLVIPSVTDEEYNAVIHLDDNTLRINGVKEFFISKDPDIYIEPKDGILEMENDMNFSFSGKIQAGNFEYNGIDFRFDYDSFLIAMPQIDSMKLKVEKGRTDIRGNAVREELENEFVETSGTLYINDPKNKSGQRNIAKYPIFDATTGAVIYFTSNTYLEGAYDQDLYVDVPPFVLDSVTASEPGSVNFGGSFGSAGLFPDFEVTLRIMEDYSMGFIHGIPADGFPVYNERGHFYGQQLRMDYNGLTSAGRLEYLSSEVVSDGVTFYQDSLVGIATSVNVRPEVVNQVDFPDLIAGRSKFDWNAYKDSLYVSNLDQRMQLYDKTATLDGQATITPGGIYGSGDLITRGSQLLSRAMYFRSDRFAARNADFTIFSDDPEKPTLTSEDVRLRFDLKNSFATISPEIEGVAALDLPFMQYKTSIPDARWNLDENKIIMTKPDDIDISKSYFYSTNKSQDSLAFNGRTAIYDINTQVMEVTGVPYIKVSDALIIPDKGTVKIRENAQIQEFNNATVVIDTFNRFHTLTDANIRIFTRTSFAGQGTYQYINQLNDTFYIKFEEFQLAPDPDNPEKYHTQSQGNVEEFQNLIISPGMIYKGKVKMYANKPALELDGYVKLNLTTIPDYDTWIQYSSNANKQEVIFDFRESRAENGFPLEAGLHFDQNTYEIYTTFVTEKRNHTDFNFFIPDGQLRYVPDLNAYIIEDTLKANGEKLAGQYMNFNENTSDIIFEGKLFPLNDAELIEMQVSGRGNGNFASSDYQMNTMILFDFDIPTGPINLLADIFAEMVMNSALPEGYGDITSLLYKMAEFTGDNAALAYDEASLQEAVPLVSASNKLVKTLVFSDVDLRWSDEYKSFYSYRADGNPTLGLSNIGRRDINADIPGFLEVKKSLNGDEVNIFMQPSPGFWYYFSYLNGRMTIFSSDNEFLDAISSKSNADKAKIGEFVFLKGDINEVQSFVDRFRSNYLGIDTPFQLGSSFGVQQTETPVEEETELDDDGF